MRSYSLLALALATVAPSALAQISFDLTGLAADGRAMRFSAALPGPVSTATVLRPSQMSCAPNCQAVGLFPDPASGRDQIVVEQQPASGSAIVTRFFFPHGALANPGAYRSLFRPEGGGRAELTVTRPGVPAIIEPAVLSAGATGVAYSAAFLASGGTPPYQFSVEPGFPLPAGISLSPTGVLGGTPVQSFQGDIAVRVTDGAGASSVRRFALRIGDGIAVATQALSPGVLGAPYNFTLQAAGGVAPVSWSLDSGSLPPGIALASNGTLFGTPTAAGAFVFTVRATASGGASASQPLLLMVSASPVILNPGYLPRVSAGAPLNIALEAAGGLPPYQWSVTSGSLPAGVTLNPAGTITGSVTGPVNANFTLQVRDSANNTAAQLFIWQSKAGVAITNPNQLPLPAGVVGAPYSYQFSVSGGSAPLSWSLSGAPVGLTISGTGLLTGTPSVAGTFSLFVTVNDSAGGSDVVPFTLTLLPAVTITTPSLPAALAGQTYSATLAASGGSGAYTWSLAAGSLPPGLSLSQTGAISGTASGTGTFEFLVRVADATGGFTFRPFSISLQQALTIESASELPPASVGVQYAHPLAASGGSPPYQWSVTGGALPAGLTLSQQGLISGTPSAAGTFSFQIQVADQAGATASRAFSILVTTGVVISTNTQLPSAVPNVPYSQTLTAAGGTGPYQWAVTGGTLPPGLTLSTAGVLSGTPTAAGTYTFQATVTDSTGASAARQFTLVVSNDLTLLSPRTLPRAFAGQPYAFTFTAGGGSSPYSWAVTGGALPAGLQLAASTGLLSGTPLTPGAYLFTVRVTDNAGASRTDSFTLVVSAGLAITTESLPAATTGAAYSQTLAASGGTPPYAWSLIAGALPPGLTLSQQGALSGTPSTSGSFAFTVRVTDAASAAAERTFTIIVRDALVITTASPLANASFGVFYTLTFEASGGVSPYQWRIASGLLPDGVSLTPAGVLSGTPRLGGLFRFVVEATDSAGTRATKEFTWTVTSSISITTGSPLPEATAGSAYSLVFGLSGGAAPFTWSLLSGSLPPGLTLSSGGILSGTPAAQGTFQFTVKVTDSAQVAAQASFTLVVGSGSQPPRAGVISQIASGGSWKTSITLLNPGAEAALVRINFFASNGAILTLPLTIIEGAVASTTTAASVQRTIPPRATLVVETEAAGSTILVGWAEVRSATPVAGFAIFRQKHGSGVDSEGTSPLETAALQSFLQPMDNLSGFSTGIALVNLAPDEAASVTAILYDDRGQEFQRGSVNLPPNGHTAFSVTDLFPAAAGRRGFIEFRADRPAGIIGLGLRFQPTLSFTSVPIIRRP